MLKIFFFFYVFSLSLYSNSIEKEMKVFENLNFQEAKKYYLENCSASKTNDYCYYFSGMLIADVRFTIKEVISFFENNCKNKIINSCNTLGFNYSTTNNPRIKKDMEKSFYYYDKACEYGDDRACLDLGMTFAEIFYSYGEIFYKNNKKAIKYLTKSCEKNQNHNSCSLLGVVYADEKQYKKAIHFLNIGCNKKSPRACYELGIIYSKNNEDKKLAKKYLNQACELKYKIACEKSKALK